MPLGSPFRTFARLAVLVTAVCASLTACGGGNGGGSGGGGIGPLRGTVNTVDVQYCIDRINAFRATLAVPPTPIVGNDQLHAFAVDGSQQLLNDHRLHQHFVDHAATLFTTDGFQTTAAENQGDQNGWPPRADVRAQIDEILQAMWNEGPGGPHRDTMADPQLLRVGVGLVIDGGGRLYFTNDFSG
jgi:uncharacterized protein YkwD